MTCFTRRCSCRNSATGTCQRSLTCSLAKFMGMLHRRAPTERPSRGGHSQSTKNGMPSLRLCVPTLPKASKFGLISCLISPVRWAGRRLNRKWTHFCTTSTREPIRLKRPPKDEQRPKQRRQRLMMRRNSMKKNMKRTQRTIATGRLKKTKPRQLQRPKALRKSRRRRSRILRP